MSDTLQTQRERVSRVTGHPPSRAVAKREAVDRLPVPLPGPLAAGNQAIQRLLREGVLQPKLLVSPPGDPLEQEADHIAEHLVSSAPPHRVQRTCAACATGTAPCPACAGEEPTLQAKARPGAVPNLSPRAAARIGGLGGGQPLPAPVRAFFEGRLGRDLGGVRVHTDAEAGEAAQSIQARAFTRGSNVVFGAGEYAPQSRAGQRLLAHELVHVVQQGGGNALIQRQAAPVGPPAPEQTPPPTTGETVTFEGVVLSENPEQLRYEMLKLVEKGGIYAPTAFVGSIFLFFSEVGPLKCHQKIGDCYGGRDSPADIEKRDKLRGKILPILNPLVINLQKEHEQYLKDFETQAKDNARNVLKANKNQALAEGIRYGITSETIEKVRYHPTGEGPWEKEVTYETRYDMDRESPAGKGLQAGAKVLLGRREEIEKLKKEQSTHLKYVRDPWDPKGRILEADAEYHVIGKQIQEKQEAYNRLRDQLSAEYPVLAAFSDLSKGTGDLETLVQKGTGPDMAALIAQQIADKVSKIDRVNTGLDDGGVNIWRLPRMVELTQAQLGTAGDPVKSKLISQKVEREQPGILADIALLVLNIAAIILAKPTLGLSLVVAAGVNAYVASEHVEEYLMKSALAGSAFHQAQALSSEDPSLFWLAVEIVGVAVDVGGAAAAMFKTFKALAPLIKTAQAAKEGEAAVTTLEAVRTAAKTERGAEFAERIVARIKAIRGGEGAALKAAGATEEELKLLQTAGKATDEAAAKGIGKGVSCVSGEVNLSKAGHILTCSSPCLVLREKYAEIFAQTDDVSKGFYRELQALEGEGQKVANARKAAEASGDAKELARTEEAANQIKQKAADLEKRIQQAHPQLAGVPDEEAVINAAKQAEAESAVTKGRLPAKADDLEKLKPVLDKPPAGVAPDDPLWKDYVSYFNDRLEALKAGKNVKPPLSWEGYSEFLGKFRRGTQYQGKVLTELREEAQLAKEGKLPADKQKMFEGMQDPVVESNVGVAGKQPGETTKFADQLIVDKASIGPGKTPKVTALSNKSRIWPEKIGAAERASVRAQVVADAEEALTKYGGDITLRRPDGPLKELFNQTVKADPVYLVYDRAYVKTTELERLITDAAAGVKSATGQKVIVIFR